MKTLGSVEMRQHLSEGSRETCFSDLCSADLIKTIQNIFEGVGLSKEFK